MSWIRISNYIHHQIQDSMALKSCSRHGCLFWTTTSLYCKNQSEIKITNNLVFHLSICQGILSSSQCCIVMHPISSTNCLFIYQDTLREQSKYCPAIHQLLSTDCRFFYQDTRSEGNQYVALSYIRVQSKIPTTLSSMIMLSISKWTAITLSSPHCCPVIHPLSSIDCWFL